MTRLLDWIGYQLVIYGPWRLTCNADTRIGSWCLDRAGGWVYRDKCPMPIGEVYTASACVEAGQCGCDNAERFKQS